MNHSTPGPATVTDPVCGMTIDPAKSAGSSGYDGQTYHFCSRGCQMRFEAAPEQYASTTLMAAESASCCSPATACC